MKIVAAICFIMLPSLASASSIPERFLGNWEDITVTKDYVDAVAWKCKFDSISDGEGGVSPIVITMTCEMRRSKSWKTKEVWSVLKIGNQDVLITASSKSSIPPR
jgi:hypothetical protein